MYDVIIVGAGAAGLTAAVYTCRKKLKTAIISIDIGGQTNLTSHIENYPGTGPMHGAELMQRFQNEAIGFGAELIMGKVNKVDKTEKGFKVSLANGETYECKALILAYGKVPRSLGIEGEEKFFGRGVSTCVTCVPPDTDIIVNYDIKKIIDLKKGEKVLTHDGTFKAITKIMKRDYKGKLIKIKPMYFREGFALTPEHPVLVWNKEKLQSEWVNAQDVRNYHILLYPIVKKVQELEELKITDYLDLKLDKNDSVHNKFETHTSVSIPNKIPVNNKFLRLVGYYLSEGCITHIGLKFSFNDGQKEYVEDVRNIVTEIFKLNTKIQKKGRVLNAYVFSSIIRDLFDKMFGKYAHNKHMSNWVLYLPKEKQAEIVKAMWRGDGCKRLKDFTYVTSSKKLAYQLRIILLRLGIVPSTEIRKKENLKPGKINWRYIHFRHDKYHIIIKGAFLEKGSKILDLKHEYMKKRNRICNYATIDETYAYIPIRKINILDYDGPVYNLAVANNNSYATSSAAVHNCDAPLYKNRDAAVIGGGNSAVEGALELATIAKKVYLIHRRDAFRADEVTVEKLKHNKTVELVLNSVGTKVIGEKNVGGIEVENISTKERRTLKVDGIFIEIGYIVDTSFVKHLVKVNEKKEIIVDENCNTSHPGIFAAGDITPVPYKQTVIAAGEGSKAALECYRWLTGGKGAVLDWS